MKRIVLAVALLVMAAGACRRAEDRGMSSDTTRADTTADTTKMSTDTTHHPDTTKARRP